MDHVNIMATRFGLDMPVYNKFINVRKPYNSELRMRQKYTATFVTIRYDESMIKKIYSA